MSFRKANLGLSIVTAVSLGLQFAPAFALANANQVADAIYKARILAAGAAIKVKVQADKASVSTYRNDRATDRDCKIEALLVGKTLFDANFGLTNVTVYFFNNKSPSEYKVVSIRTGDVKGFDSGQVSQDELLSSIEIKVGKVQDLATAIESRMMLSAAARLDVQTVENGDELEVSCKMPALSEEEYKLEAYRIADTALKFLGNGAATKRVKVIFFDPFERGKYRQVLISLNNLSTIEKQMEVAFGPLQLTSGVAKIAAKDIDPAQGVLLEQRREVLEKIAGLEAKGVGVAPFIQVYQTIEDQVGTANETALAQDLNRLKNGLEEQEKRYESAKTFTPTKDKEDEQPPPETAATTHSGGGHHKKVASRSGVTRWALEYFPLLEDQIVRDPVNYLRDCKKRFEDQIKKKAEQDARYPVALMWFAEVLKSNNRADEARQYEDQARILAAQIRPAVKKQ
ncbi:MAG: hypothetical protein K2X93_08125 [Candidatus Obscuribacterales bacterium]|nr:hypothetical protein [Candidatus Obscuribacterales bacterium]